jgi:hypothetical protein
VLGPQGPSLRKCSTSIPVSSKKKYNLNDESKNVSAQTNVLVQNHSLFLRNYFIWE